MASRTVMMASKPASRVACTPDAPWRTAGSTSGFSAESPHLPPRGKRTARTAAHGGGERQFRCLAWVCGRRTPRTPFLRIVLKNGCNCTTTAATATAAAAAAAAAAAQAFLGKFPETDVRAVRLAQPHDS